jgi:hypothetical protein
MMYEFKNSTLASLGKVSLLLFFLLALSPVNAANHAVLASNFTMLDPGGNVAGGATDVKGSFDDSKICDTESCTDFAMTLASDQLFSGVPWFAHDIRVFSEGTYTFDSSCTPAEIQAGITNCAAGPTTTLVVGPGQLGAHILFDWGSSADIDVVLLWDQDDSFGDPINDGGCPDADTCAPTQTPERVWNLVSRDGDDSGIRGFAMVDGPFLSFHANFNLDMVPQTFLDVPGDYWAFAHIEILAANGITGGCGDGNYCPEGLVTRDQMAVFLERGIRGGDFIVDPGVGNIFTDVPSDYWAGGWIELLSIDGITTGCRFGFYCPENVVKRDQMAVFLLRSLNGSDHQPPTPIGVFNDVVLSHWSAGWIEELANEGITGGCGNDNYCPNDPVTRAQMAVFLVKTFGLTIPE